MKTICFLLCLAALHAQPPMQAAGAFFALSVADAKASADWYVEKLGLKITMRGPVVILEGNGLIVELIQREDAKPGRDPFQSYGFVKAGVIVEDFDKTLALLRQRRAEIAFGPYPATKEQRANVIIKDNAGNLIQFFGESALK